MSENDNTTQIKSYELVTDALVSEALHKDKGKNVELLSWEIKDFTNKGDGYMSVVTSIMVKFKENGKDLDDSYVAKLNPLRPPSSMTDLTQDLFARETVIFSNIIENMNKHLSKLGLPPIKTPKFYASSVARGREAFLNENLRKKGFIMHDRRKGQDLNHAVLVLEELGRFHASSLLLEDEIAPKTFAETFDYFEESWLNINSPAFKAMLAVLKAQGECAIKFLREIPKYEKCVKWLKANIDSFGQYYLEGFTPRKSFDVLVHGDCWTNNMLFKYNEQNKPKDVRFVDLQCSRKASPAADISYFISSSLNGEIRSKYFKELIMTYYQSFSRVLILARKRIPFTFRELIDELEQMKIFGLIIGLIIVEGALFVEDDEEMWDLGSFSDDKLDEFTEQQYKNFSKIAEREGPFKDRFLSLFDDMIDSPVFDI